LRQSPFWVIGISYMLMAYGTFALVDFVVTYGTFELKIPYHVASLLITMIAFSGIPGAILMMLFSDRLGAKRSLFITYICIGLGILAVIAAGSHVPLLMIAVGCFGFFYGGIFPMIAACARDYFPKQITATVLGLWAVLYSFGAMSTVLTGYVADLTNTFRWSFFLAAIAPLVSGLFIRGLKNPMELLKRPGVLNIPSRGPSIS